MKTVTVRPNPHGEGHLVKDLTCDCGWKWISPVEEAFEKAKHHIQVRHRSGQVRNGQQTIPIKER